MRSKLQYWLLLPVLAILIAAPAAACIGPAPPLRLPGETDAAFQLRSESVFIAQEDEQRREWQSNMHDRAERVFIAIVTSTREVTSAGESRRTMTVRPVHALKGVLPAAPVDVRDMRSLSCQAVVGVRRTGERGDYVILFDGLRWGEAKLEPTMEVAAHEARDPRLIRALFDWGVAQARQGTTDAEKDRP